MQLQTEPTTLVSRICGADGVWTSGELPTCVPVQVTHRLLGLRRFCEGALPNLLCLQCDLPDNPINGKALYTATAYKSVVSYECK